MIGPETEYDIELLAGPGVDLGERRPGTGQQLVAPAVHELPIRFDAFWVGGKRGVLGWQWPGPLPPLFVVIGDEMKQRPFDEIAKPAAFGIGPAKIAMEQTESKLLENFIRGLRIAQHLAQVALDRAPIALKQLSPGRL